MAEAEIVLQLLSGINEFLEAASKSLYLIVIAAEQLDDAPEKNDSWIGITETCAWFE
jgi:hypothetical protein